MTSDSFAPCLAVRRATSRAGKNVTVTGGARALVLAVIIAALPIAVAAQTPLGSTFTYQAELAGPAGYVDGFYDFEFSLWDAESGGTQIGTTVVSDNVIVLNGQVSVALDFGEAAWTPGDRRWLQIVVGPAGQTKETLVPRRPVFAAPHATYATVAGSVAGGVDDADASPTNELITNLALSGTSVVITEAGQTRSVNLLPILFQSGDGHSLNTNDGQIQDVVSVNSAGLVNVGQPAVATELKLDVYGSIRTQGGQTLIENEDFDGVLTGEIVGQTFRNTATSRLRRVEVLVADPSAGVAMSVRVRVGGFAGQLLGQRTVTLSGGADTWHVAEFDPPLTLAANTNYALHFAEITGGDVEARIAFDNPYNDGASTDGGATDLAFRVFTERGGVVFPDGTIQMSADSADNEFNTSLVLNGSMLELTDAGGTLSVDLSPLQAFAPDIEPGVATGGTMYGPEFAYVRMQQLMLPLLEDNDALRAQNEHLRQRLEDLERRLVELESAALESNSETP